MFLDPQPAVRESHVEPAIGGCRKSVKSCIADLSQRQITTLYCKQLRLYNESVREHLYWVFAYVCDNYKLALQMIGGKYISAHKL